MSKTDKKRANSIITVTRFDNKLTFAFTGVGQFVFDPDRCSAENRARAMIHGFEQRIRDAAALSVDRDTGKSATPQEKFDAAKRISDHLTSGATEWNLKVAAGPKGPDARTIILAMVRSLGKLKNDDPLLPHNTERHLLTVEQVEHLLAATMAKRGVDRNGALKIWEESKQVAAMILVIKTERLAKDTDSEDLVAEMMGEGDGEEEDETDLEDEAPF